MKIFFVGSVLFSRKMFEVLLEDSTIKLVGLATKSSSEFNSDHNDLSDLAIGNGIPFEYVRDINADHICDWISELKPDIIFCLGWSSLLKKQILKIPKLGVLGFHPSELPLNKGRHPIIWSLALGLDRTASTFFLMDEKADSGDIVNQKIINISISDNSKTLYEKIIISAQIQLKEIITDLKSNSLTRTLQDANIGNHWRKRGRLDGKIDWRMRSIDIYNLVRALDHPYPGAHFEFDNNEVKVWQCEILNLENQKNIEPGKVIACDNKTITIKTGDGFIRLLEHELNLNGIHAYLL